jgi:hypothetical protein
MQIAETATKTAKSMFGTLGAVVFASIFLFSCGGSLKEKTLTVSDVSISGEADNYIKIVDGDYILKPVDDKVVIAVKFELVNKYDGSKEPELGNINLIPLDNSGVAIPDLGLDFRPATLGDWDKIKNLLKGEVGKTAIISFEWSYFSNKDIQKRIINETSNFEIARADFTGSSSSSSYEESDDEPIVSSSSEDWDAVLKSYENYIDQYIKLLKKANSGDLNALTEYAEMMEKATDLAEKMENAGDELSTSQMTKFVKLQTKLANAAANMN